MDLIIGASFFIILSWWVIFKYFQMEYRAIREAKFHGFCDDLMNTDEYAYFDPTAPKIFISSHIINLRSHWYH